MPDPKPELMPVNPARAPSTLDAWSGLRRFTNARIARGRAGGSWRTESLLEFRLAHAKARDAVSKVFEPEHIVAQLNHSGYETIRLTTAANSSALFLKRPDLGRKLSAESRELLIKNSAAWSGRQLAVIVSDGLSAQAAEQQAVPTLLKLLPFLMQANWNIGPIFIVPFARVKLQDEIGALLSVRHALMLLGERPGLGSPDSLGVYLTCAPGPDRTDADRNCVSNIRPDGFSPDEAGVELAHLLLQSAKLGYSGIKLIDAPA
jgi:ethanolamine ammonia-lyase small subunit